MQEAYPVAAAELEQEDLRRRRRGILLEASSREVGAIEAEWRRDGAELNQSLLEKVPSHGSPPPRPHPQHNVAPPPIRAHVYEARKKVSGNFHENTAKKASFYTRIAWKSAYHCFASAQAAMLKLSLKKWNFFWTCRRRKSTTSCETDLP